MENFQLLAQEFSQVVGQALTPEQMAAFERYADLLVEWNQRANLTAITQPDDIRRKHFLDSLSCLLALQGTPIAQVVDVGSGAGFPGLPLKICRPQMHLTLVESVAKKTSFLTQVVQDLGLDGVKVLTSRAESAGQDAAHRERYDWALARAVAHLPVLAEYLLPFVRVGGFVLAQKGESALEELQESQAAIEILGGRAKAPLPVSLPGIEEGRYLVVIEKISPTPEKYPRREGMPSKRPLGM